MRYRRDEPDAVGWMVTDIEGTSRIQEGLEGYRRDETDVEVGRDVLVYGRDTTYVEWTRRIYSKKEEKNIRGQIFKMKGKEARGKGDNSSIAKGKNK